MRRFHDAKINNDHEVKVWGSGNAMREFLYVDDLADACIFILEKWNLAFNKVPLDQNGEEIFWINTGSKFELSIKELANKIGYLMGYKGKIIWDEKMPDGTPRKKLDTTKMEFLGWDAKTNIDEGLKLTLSHYFEEIKNKKIRE